MPGDWAFWLAGFALALGGVVVLTFALFGDWFKHRGTLRRCPKCWYDLSGTESLTCPECGRSFKHEKKLHRSRRRWKWVFATVVLIAIGGGCIAYPLIRDVDWQSRVPTPILISFIRHTQSEWALKTLIDRLGVNASAWDDRYRTPHDQYLITPRDEVNVPMSNEHWTAFRHSLIEGMARTDNPAFLEYGLHALGRYELVDDSCADVLVMLAQHEIANIQRLAIAALTDESTRHRLCDSECIKTSVIMSESEDDYTQFLGLRALSYCTVSSATARSTIVAALKSTIVHDRMYACSVLDNECESPDEAAELLLSILGTEPSTGVIGRALSSLASAMPSDERALIAVISFADHESEHVRYYVASILADEYLNDENAIRALKHFLTDDDEFVREIATAALGREEELSD